MDLTPWHITIQEACGSHPPYLEKLEKKNQLIAKL
jgi:hypothetical protein